MKRGLCFLVAAAIVQSLCWGAPATAEDIKRTEVYARIRKALDVVPAIDTHDHLRPFD